MSEEAPVDATAANGAAEVEVDYTHEGEEGGELAELEAMLEDMEEGQTKIAEASTQASAQASSVLAAKAKLEEQKAARDERSVFVKNVNIKTTGEELSAFFGPCGAVERVTIVADRFGHPKGFAYVEFADKSAVENALVLSGTMFKERALSIITKRTNLPSFQLRGRGRGRGAGHVPRGRGGYFRGGGYAPRGGYYGGRGGGGGFRGRGRGRGGY